MKEHARHRYIFNLKNCFCHWLNLQTQSLQMRRTHACAEFVTQVEKEDPLSGSSSGSCSTMNPLQKPTFPQRNTKDKWITSCRVPIKWKHPHYY